MKISNELLNRYPRGLAAIDMEAVKNNVKNIYRAAGQKKLYCVIKANAYGHGAKELAKLYESMDEVYGYATATAEEALELKSVGIKKSVLIIGYTFDYSYEELIKNDIRITVYRLEHVKALNDIAGKMGKHAYVHIKVDTGMGRIGIVPDEEGLLFIKECLSMKNIVVEGIFSHMSKADEKDLSYAYLQLDRFNNFISLIEKETSYNIPIKHIANSASILALKDTLKLDACRAGIILYGLVPSDEVDIKKDGLVPVLSLYSHITHVKTLKKGSLISYGGTYVCETEKRIATIPLGYADGYPRSLTNKGYVLINGRKAPIVGKICMDQFMVDVSDIPDVKTNDLVTLIGKDGSMEITLDEISELSGRFNYEFVCCLTNRIHREYIYN